MDQATISLISAVGGIIAATAGLLAAGAAFRSAGIAKNAAEHAEHVEHRELVRDMVSTLQSIIADTVRVDDLANNMKRAYKGLSILHGQAGGSRERVLTAEVEKKQRGVGAFHQEALKRLEDIKSLREQSEEELTDLLVKYEGYLTQVRRVKEKLEYDLISFRDDYQP